MGEEHPEEPENTEGSEGEASDGLTARTVALAESARELMRAEAHLPGAGPEQGEAEVDLKLEPISVDDLGRAATFLRSQFLGWILGLALATSGAGVWVAMFHELHDWYMHAAMYVVILSFLVIYVKVWRRKFARALYGSVSLILIVGFSWTLHDLVAERTVMSPMGAIPRDAIPALDVPALMLLLLALALAAHGVLVRAEIKHD